MQPNALRPPEMIPIRAIFPRVGGLLRKIKPEYVNLLAESIKEIGLQTPISLHVIPNVDEYTPFSHNGNTYELAAGNHRLEACKQLGWTEIPAFLLDLPEVERALWEIDENLARGELTPVERAELLKKRKALYLAQHPETKHGGDRKSEERRKKNQDTNLVSCSSPSAFIDDTAAKTGISRTDIARSIHRAEAIVPEVMEVIRDIPEIAEKGVELDALAAVEPEDQKAAVEAVKLGKARNVREATKGAKKRKKRKPKRSPTDNEIVRRAMVAAVKKCWEKITQRIAAIQINCDGDVINVAVTFNAVAAPAIQDGAES
ncbi:MAG TPA: ParB N-terminal domain-containing protein [Verrucomicrobiae bacterium]|nr:ParB N-terminal domain-containing protein [Verrucomicrobiae bacterium]